MSRTLTTAVLLGLVALGACSDSPLEVENQNAPTVSSLLASPTGTQTLGSKVFQNVFIGQYGSSDAIWPQTMVMSGESEGAVANFGMLVRGGFPRSAIDNSPNNAVQLGNQRDYSAFTRGARQISLVISALSNFRASYDSATYARNQSFAYFTLGYSLGHAALVYDSLTIITPQTPADSVPALSSAAQAMTVALAMLDTAQQVGSQQNATAAIPATWMSTAADVPMPTFVRLVRSMKARLRANLPRTPEEGNAVNWAAVAADAQAGLTSSFIIQLNQGTNWTLLWQNQALVGSSWHQMPYWVIGLADTTGAYATWLAAANASKSPFLIRTPDRRFPSGETRAAQNAFANPAVPPADTVLYLRNRLSGNDAPGGPTNGSFYDYFRFFGYRTNNLQGPWPMMTRAESDMLAAEALIRTGRFADALPLIDRYRTRVGLPRLVGAVATASDPVPGGNACVPRFPVRSGSAVALQCANAYEAMKYEKRMETAFTGYGAWYFDARRWGDLIQGTPLEWPVPFQELLALRKSVYQNNRVSTAPNTYGWLP